MDKAGKNNEHPGDEAKLAKKIKNFIYHPSDLIGSGFSSQVYRGVNEQQTDPSKKNIAIKVIELSKIQNQVENYLLNNEVNALKLLKHPNILQTVDILMTKNNVYIVTEFCEGGDLLKYIKSNGPFNELRALTLIKEIVEGYKCIEQNNIIHRDLKTSNIFLSKGKPKIADFGFCEFVGEKKPQVAYNVGSPAYMSPESYKENHYSHKSDIWAIGIMLYEMLIGETPDRTLTYTQMVTNLMNGKIKGIHNEEIRKILSLCFKKILSERIDATALCELISLELNRLQNASNSQPVPQEPPIHRPNIQQRNFSPVKTKQNKYFSKSEVTQPRISSSPVIKGLSRLPPNPDSKQRPAAKPDILKPHTEYLLFLYRLLKFITELKLQKIFYTLLPIFRHRNLIESVVEQLALTEDAVEPYKQFEYLKTRFDEVYMKHLKQYQNLSPGNHKQKLDLFANYSFVHGEALQLYRGIIKEACQDCLAVLEGRAQIRVNRSQIGIIFDYLMIEYELLGLHSQGLGLVEVVAMSKLDAIIKEQPRKLTPGHIELLKLKYSAIIDQPEAPQLNPVRSSQQLSFNQIMQETSARPMASGNPPPLINGMSNAELAGTFLSFNPQTQSFQPQPPFVNAPPRPFAPVLNHVPIHQSLMMPSTR